MPKKLKKMFECFSTLFGEAQEPICWHDDDPRLLSELLYDLNVKAATGLDLVANLALHMGKAFGIDVGLPSEFS